MIDFITLVNKLGGTQTVAELTGLHRHTVSKLMHNKNLEKMRADTYLKLSEGLPKEIEYKNNTKLEISVKELFPFLKKIT